MGILVSFPFNAIAMLAGLVLISCLMWFWKREKKGIANESKVKNKSSTTYVGKTELYCKFRKYPSVLYTYTRSLL